MSTTLCRVQAFHGHPFHERYTTLPLEIRMKDVTIPQPEHRIVDVEKTVRFSNEKATLAEIIVTPHSSIVV